MSGSRRDRFSREQTPRNTRVISRTTNLAVRRDAGARAARPPSATLPALPGRERVARRPDPPLGTTLLGDARGTTQSPGPSERSSALRKQTWGGQGHKPAKQPLAGPVSVPPSSPRRDDLAPRPLQRIPRVEGAPRAVPPTPEHPRELSSRPSGRRGFPAPRGGRPQPERGPSEAPPRAGPAPPRALTFQSASAPPPPRALTPDGRAPAGSGARGKSRLWEGLGAGPEAGGRAGAASGSEPRGRSGRSALVWERCGLPLPTEVGRGARRRRRRPGAGRGGLCAPSPRGDVGLAGGPAACRGGTQPAAPLGKGASRRLLALPLARNFGVGQVRGASRDPGAAARVRAFPAAAGGVEPMCVFPVIRGDAGPPLLPR